MYSSQADRDGSHILLIIYVDDIIILSGKLEWCEWVKNAIQKRYEKITVELGPKINYLGMILEQAEKGFKISMRAYILDVLNEYGKDVKKCISPAKGDLFESGENDEEEKDIGKFHTMVVKLLYLGKRGRPDILLPVQYLCTKVKNPTKSDVRKLERVLGYRRWEKPIWMCGHTRWNRSNRNLQEVEDCVEGFDRSRACSTVRSTY
jgi:hypothetical protein